MLCPTLINLLLLSLIILSSCSKEDDLLTPVTNPTNTIQVNDSTTYTVTGGDSTVLCPWDAEYVHDESLTTTTNNGTLVLEGSKYTITYSSFYLRNKWPVCTVPYDTTIFEEHQNTLQNEVYFSNQGDGYIRSKTYARDCETPLMNGSNHLLINPYWEQGIESYTIENNKILVNVLQYTGTGAPWRTNITFDIIQNTDRKLVIENKQIWLDEPNLQTGYLGVDCERTVRFELEKVN